MALPIGPTVGILADNLKLRGSVFPIPAARATAWTRGLGLPSGGETVLYTGSMYQLVPYIAAMGHTQERLGDSWLGQFAALGRTANKVVNISSFMARPKARERAEYDRILRNIAGLLRRGGVAFGYLYEDELYSGTLAYDLGADEVLAAHAQRVLGVLRKHGTRRLITVDPHTTDMFRSVYPKLIAGWDLEVKSYLEVLAEREEQTGAAAGVPVGAAAGVPVGAAAGASGQAAGEATGRAVGRLVAIHDSCVYARYLGLIDEPRRLLAQAGYTVGEPEAAGRLTWCCAGPAESLYPRKALEGAGKRVAQLAEVAPKVVTMCPICLVNLRRAAPPGVRIDDISTYLAG